MNAKLGKICESTKFIFMEIPIPKVNVRTDWYIHEYGKNQEISPTEKIIQQTLIKMNKLFFREVSFRGFGHPYSPFRFDFYLPQENLLIEYDGRFHRKKEQKDRDKIKDMFCKIKLIRFNIKHYKTLSEHVKKVLTTN